MTKLNDAQATHIERLQAGMTGLNAHLKQLEAQFRRQRDDAKVSVALLVREALDAGVPARQVALKGLGYADVGSLRQYTDLADWYQRAVGNQPAFVGTHPLPGPGVPGTAVGSAPAFPSPTVDGAAPSGTGPYPVEIGWDADMKAFLVTDTFGKPMRNMLGTFEERRGTDTLTVNRPTESYNGAHSDEAAILAAVEHYARTVLGYAAVTWRD